MKTKRSPAPIAPPKAPDPLAELLGTNKPDEQAQRVQMLINAAQAPVLDVLIQHDARTGSLSYRLSMDVPYPVLINVLDQVRTLVVRQQAEDERKAEMQRKIAEIIQKTVEQGAAGAANKEKKP
jgi:hypothetical protein